MLATRDFWWNLETDLPKKLPTYNNARMERHFGAAKVGLVLTVKVISAANRRVRKEL